MTALARRVAPALGARLDRAIERALGQRRLVGAVVLVSTDAGVCYRRAAGWADREALVAMHEGTPFRIASLTKPIVAATAMVLLGRGRLALDDRVDRWLPWFRPALADGRRPAITLDQLMSHQAGLGYRFMERSARGPYARAGVSDGLERSGLTLAENLRRLASVPLLDEPGTVWRYSLASDVLGAVVEQASGLPLGEAVRTLVTGPLGLSRTGFVADEPARLAVPYVESTVDGASLPRRLGEREIFSHSPDVIGIAFEPARAGDRHAFPSGGSGMVGCADDFMHFLETLRRGGAPILGQHQVDELARDRLGGRPMRDAPGQGHGLGFAVLRDPRLAGSPQAPGTWSWAGAYGHSWFVDRSAGVSVVALTNTLYEGMSGRFVTELRDAVYADS